jgi:hypothetical protein
MVIKHHEICGGPELQGFRAMTGDHICPAKDLVRWLTREA